MKICEKLCSTFENNVYFITSRNHKRCKQIFGEETVFCFSRNVQGSIQNYRMVKSLTSGRKRSIVFLLGFLDVS